MSVQKLNIVSEVQSRKMKDALRKAFSANANGEHLVITIRRSSNGLSIRAEPVEKNTVFIGGTITRRDRGRYVNEHVIVQTQFRHKEVMNSMGGEPVHARFNGDDSWRIDSDGVEHLIRTVVNEGFGVQMKPETVASLFDVYNESEKESSETGNKAGGVTPDVEAGECPACGKDCGGFKSLRGHIGGKVRGGDELHMNLGIKLEDYK